MGDTTKIEWTDATWTPIRAGRVVNGKEKFGWHCTHVSEGCRNCYAERWNVARGTGLPFKPGHESDINIFLDEKMLLNPLKWKKPKRIFVCSMTDLFADFVKDEWIDRMFAVMSLCPEHTFQILTKRPEHMLAWFKRDRARTAPAECLAELYVSQPSIAEKYPFDASRAIGVGTRGWPLPNVWLGTSVEDQDAADERIPHLLAAPAAVRFLSVEPMLGPIDVKQYLTGREENGVDMSREAGSRVGACIGWTPPVDWVICGGESGPHARPMHPDWPRRLRDHCAIADVPFHFKQWGEFKPQYCDPLKTRAALRPGGLKTSLFSDGQRMFRVGKSDAGRTLDGIEHNGFPEMAA